MDYNDEYPTCSETFATLRVFSDRLNSLEISSILTHQPTYSHSIGELRSKYAPPQKRYFAENGWSYCTQELSTSRDCRGHLDVLIDGPLSNTSAVAKLHAANCDIDVVVFYCYSQGGPIISPRQMSHLAAVNVEVWWDLYRDELDDNDTRGRDKP